MNNKMNNCKECVWSVLVRGWEVVQGVGHFEEGGLPSRGSHVALMFSPQCRFEV